MEIPRWKARLDLTKCLRGSLRRCRSHLRIEDIGDLHPRLVELGLDRSHGGSLACKSPRRERGLKSAGTTTCDLDASKVSTREELVDDAVEISPGGEELLSVHSDGSLFAGEEPLMTSLGPGEPKRRELLQLGLGLGLELRLELGSGLGLGFGLELGWR